MPVLIDEMNTKYLQSRTLNRVNNMFKKSLEIGSKRNIMELKNLVQYWIDLHLKGKLKVENLELLFQTQKTMED